MARKNRKRRSQKTYPHPKSNKKVITKTTIASRFTSWSLAPWLILAAIPLLIYFFMLLLSRAEIGFDFRDQRTMQEWKIAQGEIDEISHSDRGLKIKVKQGYGLLVNSDSALDEREKTLSSRAWKNAPYVKLFISPEDHDRTLILVWWISDQKNAQIPFVLPAMAESVVVDTRAWVPWRRVFPFFQDGTIRQIGLGFPRQIEINRVEFLSVLEPADLFKNIFQQLANYEPIAVSSINFQYGLNVLGRSYIMTLGFLVLAMGIVALIFPRRKTCVLFFTVSVVCVVLADISRFQTLWRYAEEGYKVSSLYDDRYEEFRSRFGEEFAQLDQALKKYVPEQSKVAFPRSSNNLVMGETNWIWFLYQGEYENNNDRGGNPSPIRAGVDYIFYYHPERYVHDPESQALLLAKNGKKLADVELVSEISERAKLLRVAHD